jgi:ubiquinone/menaquinone biosynthesis C-methylase UbiE
VGRRDIVRRLLESIDVTRNDSILEVGCGSGALIEELENDGYTEVVGLDMSALAVDAARARGVDSVVQGDATALEYEDDSFDVVVASDVLEHLMNERRALAEWNRVLKPGGALVIFVPAFAFLWSHHDVENQHFRRYSRSMLESVLEQSDYSVERLGYWNGWLFGPVAGVRMLQRIVGRKTKSDETDKFVEMNGVAATAFKAMFRLENAFLGAGGMLPVGVSVFAIARPNG